MHDLTGARKAPLTVLFTLFFAISLLTLGYLYWIVRARMTLPSFTLQRRAFLGLLMEPVLFGSCKAWHRA
jgi:hypothetical protein